MSASPAVTTFVVSMRKPETHVFEIEMRVAPFVSDVARFDLVLPVWAPGSYFVRDYARNVQDFSVTDAAGTPVPFAMFGQDGRVNVTGAVRVIDNLAPGSYALSGQGFSKSFTVAEGGKTVVDLP